jgi:hypothetical protein
MAKHRTSEVAVAAAAAATAARLLERGFVARFTQRFAQIAIRQGIRKGSRPWLYAWAGAMGFRYVTRFVGRKEEVHRFKLKRGEGFSIRELPPAPKKRGR